MPIKPKVSIVIPAYNEEQAIGLVVAGFRELRDDQQQPLVNEIIVADNGSIDNTAAIADAAGAKVVYEATPGYGYACMKAISHLDATDIIVFCDGDYAFFADQLPTLLQAIQQSNDLVIGSRTSGQLESGSLTTLQQWGNQLAVFLIHSIWGYQYTDLGPFRAIRKDCFDHLKMQEFTFGWTVEMQIKVLQSGFQVCEVPVNTRVRLGQSKVSGTVKGAIGAGVGILSTIAKLWWRQNEKTTVLKGHKICN